MASLTAANAVIVLTISGLIDTPFQLQQFAADDVTDLDSVQRGEFLMGVDGHLTGGYVNVMYPQRVVLMADSPSISIFETWSANQNADTDLFWADGTITLPAVNKKYQLTRGGLRDYKPVPDVKKIIQPQAFTILWESVSPAPYGVAAV